MKDFVRKFLNAVLPFLCVFGGFALVIYSFHVRDNNDIILLTSGFLLVITGSWMKRNEDDDDQNTSMQC